MVLCTVVVPTLRPTRVNKKEGPPPLPRHSTAPHSKSATIGAAPTRPSPTLHEPVSARPPSVVTISSVRESASRTTKQTNFKHAFSGTMSQGNLISAIRNLEVDVVEAMLAEGTVPPRRTPSPSGMLRHRRSHVSPAHICRPLRDRLQRTVS